MADAKIVKVESDHTALMLQLDCSWTALNPDRYITQLIFENCTALALPDITGMFWHHAQVSVHGDWFQLRLEVADERDHKKGVELRFSSGKRFVKGDFSIYKRNRYSVLLWYSLLR